MTRLDLVVIEEAIRLLEDGELFTVDGKQVWYSCWALALAQGFNYDSLTFDDHNNAYLRAYRDFSFKRFGYYPLPVWWSEDSPLYQDRRIENLRSFKQAVEQGEIE